MPLPTPLFPEASSHDWEARDRQERARVARLMIFAGAISLPVALACGLLAGATGVRLLMYGVLGAPAGMTIIYGGVVWLPRAASEGFLSFLWPNRGEAARQIGYSHIQAMAASGDVAGALAAYEDVIATNPAAIEPRVQAAELYAKGSDPARAARLFAEIRRIPGCSSQHDLYATQRLVDLYDGALQQPQRSLTELRRIVELHRESREAHFAKEALVRRKREG
jgi:hypothetical protein